MTDQVHYGPGNPHPLSQVKTELIWEGKYDEHGNRREVDVAGCVLPLQKVESIDEPRSHAEGAGQMDLFKKQSKRRDDFRNRLIWGDNKLVLSSLLAEFKAQIDLIYIDPPFDVGADFTMSVPLGEEGEEISKDQSALEMVAYRDTWGRGTDSYLHMIYERLVIMRELLKDTGSIFVHCDWRVNCYLHTMLKDVFGDNLRNEIIWCYTGPGSPGMSQFNRKHDNIYWFSKKEKGFKFNDREIRIPHDEKTQANFKAGLKGSGFIGDNYDLPPGKIPEDWWEFAIAARYPVDGMTRTGYATEKPWPLIERVVRTCTEEGDLVADFFCGSGTTGAVAERIGRRWIMCDLGRYSIHTTRKRMIEIQRDLYDQSKPYRAFDVYNLGRYERQWWQKERLAGAEEEHRRIVLAFYRAEPLTGPTSTLLHGRKGPALIHVDGIDSILTLAELKPIVEAAHAAGAKEIHCLAWEFEMELKRNAEALEHEHGVKIRLIRIPREVMEKNRRPGVDHVPFFEMATLTAETVVKIEGGVRIADVKLTNFLPSLSEVSNKELEALQERAVKSGFDFIDFWAVDFDHKDDQPFKHHWQDYRLRKDRSLKLQSDCGHRYEDNEPHRICVKVIDTFGCDTSILLDVPGARGKK
jgi:adenine-specific DNA-methyltransferase